MFSCSPTAPAPVHRRGVITAAMPSNSFGSVLLPYEPVRRCCGISRERMAGFRAVREALRHENPLHPFGDLGDPEHGSRGTDVLEHHSSCLQHVGFGECLHGFSTDHRSGRLAYAVGRFGNGLAPSEPATGHCGVQRQPVHVLRTHRITYGYCHPVVRAVHHDEHEPMDEHQVPR